MISIKTVAQYIIKLCSDDPQGISNMKLQKLCYFTQAWYLAEHHKPLFSDDFEAWIYGPVSRLLYNHYRHFGKDPITIKPDSREISLLSHDEKAFIKKIFHKYGKFSAIELMVESHKDPAWTNARNGVSPNAQCSHLISKEEMEKSYADQV